VVAVAPSPASSGLYSSGIAFTRDFTVREGAYEQVRAKLEAAPLDTRSALADYVSEGDEFQKKIIESREPTIRLVAPAGSGKTQTVIHRVLSRIRDGTKPERILDSPTTGSIPTWRRSPTKRRSSAGSPAALPA